VGPTRTVGGVCTSSRSVKNLASGRDKAKFGRSNMGPNPKDSSVLALGWDGPRSSAMEITKESR